MKKYNFAIFGYIDFTSYFIKQLKKYNFPKPILFISFDNEYKRDKSIFSKYNLYSDISSLEKEGLCKIYKVKNVNSKQVHDLLKKNSCNIGISINCRNKINQKLIDFFKSKLFNIHAAHLPSERGGGIASWKILNDLNDISSTIHKITVNFDDGDIILNAKKNLKIDKLYPIDIIRESNLLSKKLLTTFLKNLLNQKKFKLKKQSQSRVFYYPRLFTPKNAAINWNWDVKSIYKFIRAFSYPYEGSWCFINKIKINILEAEVLSTNKINHYHPFMNGKVIRTDNKYNSYISCNDGILIIKKISILGKISKPGKIIKVGQTLFNYSQDLLKSKITRINTESMK